MLGGPVRGLAPLAGRTAGLATSAPTTSAPEFPVPPRVAFPRSKKWRARHRPKRKKLPKKEVLRARNRKWTIIRGDTVSVVRGEGQGETGKVLAVMRKYERVLVEGVNVKQISFWDETTGQGRAAVETEIPVPYDDVCLIDPEDKQPTEIRTGYLADGRKVRVSKRSGKVIPWPALDYKRDDTEYECDTPPEEVLKRTYFG